MTSVSPEYVHVRKQLSAGEGLELSDVSFKWYDLHRESHEIGDDVRKEARDFLRVYLKVDGEFELMPFPETGKGTYCVWELGAVLHEQQAWIRYLFSARDADAGAAYLADQHPGGLI